MFRGVDLIVHAGDLCCLEVLDPLRNIAPVVSIWGNNDGELVRRIMPASLSLRFLGCRVDVIHGHGGGSALTQARRLADGMKAASCVIFGHSHHSYNDNHGETLLFNPGSPTDKRSSGRRSVGILTIEQKVDGRIIELT